MKEYRLPRNKEHDYEFIGKLAGRGAAGIGGSPSDMDTWTHGTEVAIYTTDDSAYVVHVTQWSSRWSTETSRVGICATKGEVVAWLNGDARGPMGDASTAALENAGLI